MLERYGLRAIYDAGSHVEANLGSVLSDKVWIWKSARSHQLVDIQSKLHLVEIKEEDKAFWSSTPTFVCAETWNEIREKWINVDWWKVLWFNLAIPKHWMVMLNRIPTKARMIQWGINERHLVWFLQVATLRIEIISFSMLFH